MKQSRIPRSVGGSRPQVQATSQIMASDPALPQLAARIYAPPAVKLDCDTDPRYPDKDTQVENIYFPSALPQDRKTRSGISQVFNWLFTGKME